MCSFDDVIMTSFNGIPLAARQWYSLNKPFNLCCILLNVNLKLNKTAPMALTLNPNFVTEVPILNWNFPWYCFKDVVLLLYFFLQSTVYAVRAAWSWLQQASICMETHLRNAAAYHQVCIVTSERIEVLRGGCVIFMWFFL